jgi:hypothetical protein
MMKNGHIKIKIVVIILYIALVKAQSVYSTIPKIPYTSIVYESILSSSLIYDPNSTIPNSTLSSSNEPNLPYYTKRSSSGLSAGAICAIIIPTIAALLAVAAIAALLKGATAPVVAAPFQASLPLESSVAKFNAVQEIPIQKPQPIQVQPVKEVTQVNYPVEPPKVVTTQPVQVVPVQEVQMVPVQQVDMVPVQQVDMVPVQQVDMVPVQQVVTEVKEVQALPTQVLPTINA